MATTRQRNIAYQKNSVEYNSTENKQEEKRNGSQFKLTVKCKYFSWENINNLLIENTN